MDRCLWWKTICKRLKRDFLVRPSTDFTLELLEAFQVFTKYPTWVSHCQRIFN
jgi:hypothetical protein